MKQLSGLEACKSEDFPPIFYFKSTEEEFPEFIANQTTTMKELKRNIDGLTVAVRNSAGVRKEELE